MIKSELIAAIADKMNHLPVTTVEKGVALIIGSMTQALATGQRVEIRGFGSFALRKMPERLAHNPKTGVKLVAEAKHKIHFKPGLELKARVYNAWQNSYCADFHGR